MPREGPFTIADIDLDRLATGYEHRSPQPSSLVHAAAIVKSLDAGAWALDVGGGRGDHAAVWADRGIRAVVLDPSERMAMAAAAHPGVDAVRGVSQAMPFRDRSFSVVRFHLSIHYGDWKVALGESRRILAPGGVIDIWTLGPRHHRRSNLSRWFPRIVELDEMRFPNPEKVAAELRSLGLAVEAEQHDERIERAPAEWIAAVRAGFVSTLQLLTAEEIERGLDRFARTHPGDAPLVYVLRYDRIIATDPGSLACGGSKTR